MNETAARLRAVPAWVWVAGLVLVSALVRIALSREVAAPWIMVDELVYSELAKSFAAHGHFAIRGVATGGYGDVYPVLIAPAWRLYSSVPHAYAVAKGINSVVISLTAIPAYLLARRLVSVSLALIAAVLSVLVPSMLYAGTLMTENAFYPLFVSVCLALVLALERPTLRRQVVALALIGLAYLTRAQTVALVPAAAVAPLLFGLIGRDVRAQLRAFMPTYVLFTCAAGLALLWSAIRSQSPLHLLGAYQAATSTGYSTHAALHYLLWHVEELDLYLGVIPFAALLVLWLSARSLPRSARALVAVSFPVSALLIVEVALFASRQSLRIEERNMFYVAPLALIALLALPSYLAVRRPLVIAAASVAAVLPFFFPFGRFIDTPAVSDTIALLPWWWVTDHPVWGTQIRVDALVVAVAFAVAFVVVPRRYSPALAAIVAATFVVTTAAAQNGRHGIRIAAVGALYAGIRVQHPDWVDRAVGHDADVAFIWNGRLEAHSVWETEFFNRSVGRVYDLGGAVPGGLPETHLTRAKNGDLVDPAGHVPHAQYALTSDGADLVGRVIGRDSKIGMYLVRVRGPLIQIETKITGLYTDPGDTWSRKQVVYSRSSCTGGHLAVLLQSDAGLYATDQIVTATVHGRRVARAHVPPAKLASLVIRLVPDAQRVCRVRFTVARTLVPADVIAGSTDTRALGAHFLRFEYRQ